MNQTLVSLLGVSPEITLSVPVMLTVTNPVKDLEGLPDLVLGVLVGVLHRHHQQELGEIYIPRSVLNIQATS